MEREEQEKIFSKTIKAGKRTYFFDVRATRSRDYFLTLTESRRYQKEGDFVYEKSKIFIYKEDFEKVLEALQESIHHIKTELMPEVDFSKLNAPYEESNYKNKSIDIENPEESTSYKWE